MAASGAQINICVFYSHSYRCCRRRLAGRINTTDEPYSVSVHAQPAAGETHFCSLE